MRQSQCLRRVFLSAVGGSALLLTVLPDSQASTQGPIEVIAPTYYGMTGDPASWWQDLENNFPQNQPNSLIVVNPASGPGTSVDPILFNNMTSLGRHLNWHDMGYLDYIDMPVGFMTSTVSAEADRWAAMYGYSQQDGAVLQNGFFFDDLARDEPGQSMSSDLAQIEWAVNNVVANHWVPYVVMNASGAYTTTAGLFYCVGRIVQSYGIGFYVVTVETYENATRSQVKNDIMTHSSDFAPGGPLNWVYNYRPTYFAGLIHDATASAVSTDIAQLAQYNIGFAFVTDQPVSNNAWAPGPSDSVWSQLRSNTGSNAVYTYDTLPSVPPLSFTCPDMAP